MTAKTATQRGPRPRVSLLAGLLSIGACSDASSSPGLEPASVIPGLLEPDEDAAPGAPSPAAGGAGGASTGTAGTAGTAAPDGLAGVSPDFQWPPPGVDVSGDLSWPELARALCERGADARLDSVPGRLSETGLYADLAAQTLADGVVGYEPSFALWSDGASKRRFVWLPPGTEIDTTDPDDWQFPVGTKFWKEFERDGVRVETRLLWRIGDGVEDWATVAYIWQPDQNDAIVAPDGQFDAGGTTHDVPSSDECGACHGGTRSHVLGFSAIQLAATAEGGGWDLAGLSAQGLLSAPLPEPIIPGDPGERAALGYLHANCGHCHNQASPAETAERCFTPTSEVDFRLYVDALGSVAETGAAQAFSGPRGRLEGELMLRFVENRGLSVPQMPPLSSEVVDADGAQILRAFVEGLAQ